MTAAAAPPTPATPGPHRNLVYTSAGDNACLDRWLGGRRNFDLFVTYYGDRPERYRGRCNGWWARKGSKFANLHHLWQTDPGILAPYDAVMVLDDDILIDGDDISMLFDLRRDLDLSVLQPAFEAPSKISHPITRRQHDYVLRFTEFAEMNTPLFRRASLEAFLREYDPVVVGYGVDYWYMNVLYREPEFRCAVVDSVPCINPHESQKGGVREIDRLQPEAERRTHWERIQRTRGLLDVDTTRVLGAIRRPLRERWGVRLRRLVAKRSAGNGSARPALSPAAPPR